MCSSHASISAGNARVGSTRLLHRPPLHSVIFATPLFVLDEGGPWKKKKFRNGGERRVQENVNDRTHMAPSGSGKKKKKKHVSSGTTQVVR